MTKVSVIIPLFDRGHLISRALNSLCSQDFDDWEAIVVDDGSTDNGPEIVREFARKEQRIRLVNRSREPRGPSCCRNIGADNSTGKYLVFLDSDDELASHCVGTRYQYMESHPDLDFAVFPLESFSETPGDKGEIFNTYCEDQEDYLHLFLQDEAPWQTTCPIWKKDFYLKIGGFNEDFLVKTDPELHSRALLLHQPRFEVVKSNPDCYYRINHHDEVKSSYFDEAAVLYRVKFLKLASTWIHNPLNKKSIFQQDLKVAFLSLYRHYLVARVRDFEKVYFDTLQWGRAHHLVSSWNHRLLQWIGKASITESSIFRKLRLVGVFYKLLNLN